jgi:sugar lactone lactonase YvrE
MMNKGKTLLLGLLLGVGSAQAQGLEYLLPEGESRVIFSTHSHTYDDGTTPRGVFDGLVWIPTGAHTGSRGYLFMNNELEIGNDPPGGVTRLTYNGGQITAAELWVSGLSRPCSAHDSPWGTVLVSEEDDSSTDGSYGFVVEIDPLDKNNWHRRKAMGRASWENTVAHPATMNFYLTDDARPTSNKGAFYKFVPDQFGDLSSGRLYAFKADQGGMAARSGGVWVEITDLLNAQAEAFAKGATLYDRPEDLAYNPVDNWLYICMTGNSKAEDVNRRLGAIYRFDAVNNVMERWLEATGTPMAMPDNIEIDPHGNLWICEDGDTGALDQYGPNELILVRPDKSTQVVMRGTEKNGEVSGVLWRPDGKGFWVEWQHGKDPNGAIAGGADYDELYEVTLPPQYQAVKPWIYADDSPTAVSSVETAALPQSLGLDQNYPNPFNPETTLHFQIPQHSEVKLTIYNASGQQVATLVDQPLNAGTYQTTWDGRDAKGNPAASGTYIYSLQAGDRIQSRQMILLK